MWKAIPGYPGYEASDSGQIRSTARVIARRPSLHRPNLLTRALRERILKPVLKSDGHVQVGVGGGRVQLAHRLVLLAFVGPCPAGHEAMHLSGVPDDNRLSNLRWGTKSDNIKQAWADGAYDGTRRP